MLFANSFSTLPTITRADPGIRTRIDEVGTPREMAEAARMTRAAPLLGQRDLSA
jgi:hypothetical protein